MVHAQEPTCIDLRIRSTQDTHKIFFAIQKGLLKMVTRRLDADERLALRSGCVYAWEERGPHSEITGLGIERFTEGRRWTPSRVRDEFLFYYERYMPLADANQAGSQGDSKPPRDWEPLVKQTYSVWVETEGGRRKWHLTAYFTQGTIDQLRSVDDLPGVRDLVVPDGHFKSTRVGKNRSKQDESRGESSKSSSVNRQYAAFPSPYSATSSAIENTSVVMYDPYQNSAGHTGFYQPQSQESEPPQSRLHSHSPQNRSSGSLTPPVPSTRVQYPTQPPQYHSASLGDSKSSRMDGPVASGHPAHSHPSEYRGLPPMSAPAPMVPSQDSHGQRGKPITISSFAASTGLNNHVVNTFVGPTSDSFAPSAWDNGAPSTSFHYETSSTALPPSTSVSMQNGNEQGPSMNHVYMYPNQQLHHPQTFSSSTMSHSNLATMAHHYDLPHTHSDLMVVSPLSSNNTLSDTPRTLPPLHIAPEDPYIISPGCNYSQLPVNGSIPSLSPSPTGTSRPSPCRALAPLYAINRPHPYKRDHQDDKALRSLLNPSSTSPPLYSPP